MKVTPFLLFLFTLPLLAQECIDFEDFANGASFSGSRGVVSYDTTFVLQGIQLPDGTVTNSGSASVGPAVSALGSGKALNVNNARIEICLPCMEAVSFRFSNQGGYFNFSVDESKVEVPFNQPGNLSIEGVEIDINGQTSNNRFSGEITLTAKEGTFDCFSIGGQELQIDDICFLTCENPSSPDSSIPELLCVEFEDLDGQGPFQPGSAYAENGIAFEVTDYDGDFGRAESSELRRARHLGQEFYFENAGFTVRGDCWSAVKFHFSSKQALSVAVNGMSKKADRLQALDGSFFGDVAFSIIPHATDPDAGIACLVGRIESLSIISEGFYIDHFCAAACRRDCIDFEGEDPQAKYDNGDIITEDGYELIIVDKTGIPVPALISTAGLANGGGNELALEGGGVSFGKICLDGLAFQYGQKERGVRLVIDGEVIEVDYVSELDGTAVAGMTIDVLVTQASSDRERGVVRLEGIAGELSLTGQSLFIDKVCLDECPDPLVVGFDEENPGEVYQDGDILSEDDLELEICDFRVSDTGVATIVSDNETGGRGQAIALSFASVKFDLLCDSGLSFQYANFGANGGPQGFGLDVRLTVNGESSGQVQGFGELDGLSLGGVTVDVFGSESSGRVELSGSIESIVVGGFNIQLDELIRTPFSGGPQCHDFDTWDASLTYGSSDESYVILADGTTANFGLFFDADENVVLDGTAEVVPSQEAGGSGQELRLRQTSLDLYLLGDWADVSFRFAERGGAAQGDVSLLINNDLQVRHRITDFDGEVFNEDTESEVTVTVLSEIRDGQLVGIVKLSGIVSYLQIGAQNLVIDDICGTQQPAPVFIDSWVVSVEPFGDQIIYVWDVEALNVQDSDFLIRRSEDLVSFRSFGGGETMIQSHGAGTDLYRVTTTQPADVEKRFYRVELRAN
ncbi:MAG: hypothetical protein Q7Q71_15335 [Verrucomicrobiota bacterium JB023]|nr:hypothetical protein [Verrucomicrobiota bacterium JB023]